MSRTRRRAQRDHFQRRCDERLGVAISRDEVRVITEFIESGAAQLVEDQRPRGSLWGVCIKGVDCVAAYDAARKTVVTVLTREMYEK